MLNLIFFFVVRYEIGQVVFVVVFFVICCFLMLYGLRGYKLINCVMIGMNDFMVCNILKDIRYE